MWLFSGKQPMTSKERVCKRLFSTTTTTTALYVRYYFGLDGMCICASVREFGAVMEKIGPPNVIWWAHLIRTFVHIHKHTAQSRTIATLNIYIACCCCDTHTNTLNATVSLFTFRFDETQTNISRKHLSSLVWI